MRNSDEGSSGGGITIVSQIEHDTEGTLEEQQQQTEESGSRSTTDTEGPPEEEQQQRTGSESLSIPEESRTEISSEEGKTWATQAAHSKDENERRKEEVSPSLSDDGILDVSEWELCNVTAGPDYIPCLDNEKAIKQLHSFSHFEHRERHCPKESPTCLVPLPEGYKRSIEWTRAGIRYGTIMFPERNSQK